MREIEIKVRVRNIDVILHNIKKASIILSHPIKQHDRVYAEHSAKDNILGANWLRIRTENDSKHYFTLKKSVVGHLDSIEYETLIYDPKELESIIKELHFEPYSDLTKTRRKAKVGEIEICLDVVDRLGTFMEAEILTGDDADHNEIEDKLWLFLENLGLDKSDQVLEGYDVLERKLNKKPNPLDA